MSPLHPGEPGDGHGEDDDRGVDDEVGFRPPLPPEDRIWRHPSEVAAAGASAGGRATVAAAGDRSQAGVAIVSALAGAVLALGVAAAFGAFDGDTRLVERQVAVQPVTGGDSEASTVAAIATRTAPAVAAVRVERDGATVPGSALVYRSDGHLLTSAHLLDGAEAIVVRLHDGWSGAATLVGVDAVTDVAVLHVDASDLHPAALGSPDTVRIGDRAVAMGAASDGGWSPAVATGVVSGLERRVRTADHVLHDLIVVDVPLGAGAEGGALLDAHGAVVGMTGAPSPGDGLAAATPIDVVQRVADQLIEHGRARHVWLGIEGNDLSSADAMAMAQAGGARINLVLDGSPAAAAGLRAGDVVVAAGDHDVGSMSDLITALRLHLPGDAVALVVRRGAETVTIEVVLAERQD